MCDITYLHIKLVFSYLSLSNDACSKRTVGYCLHLLLTVEGSLKALEMALQSKQPHPVSLVHHSDRGSQYCSLSTIQRLRQVGDCSQHDAARRPLRNAVAERVNSILKTDFRLNRVLTTFDEATRAVEQSVRNDNHLRPHMSC